RKPKRSCAIKAHRSAARGQHNAHRTPNQFPSRWNADHVERSPDDTAGAAISISASTSGMPAHDLHHGCRTGDRPRAPRANERPNTRVSQWLSGTVVAIVGWVGAFGAYRASSTGRYRLRTSPRRTFSVGVRRPL